MSEKLQYSDGYCIFLMEWHPVAFILLGLSMSHRLNYEVAALTTWPPRPVNCISAFSDLDRNEAEAEEEETPASKSSPSAQPRQRKSVRRDN